jgi:hypothetical protein
MASPDASLHMNNDGHDKDIENSPLHEVDQHHLHPVIADKLARKLSARQVRKSLRNPSFFPFSERFSKDIALELLSPGLAYFPSFFSFERFKAVLSWNSQFGWVFSVR